MQMPRPLLLAILIPFALYSSYVTFKVGYFGIWTSHFHLAGMQVLTDLIIACTLAMIWMWRDAKSTGRNALPYVLLTVVAGTFGPLLYLLLAPQAQRANQRVMA